MLEKLSRGIILSKSISGKLGKRKIYVSPEAGLRYWKPGIKDNDTMLVNTVANYIHPDSVVWDIGANLGMFSFYVLINHKNVKCLMLEPDIWLCNLIRKTAIENKDWAIDLIPMAVSSKIGLATFNIANRSRQTNYLADSEGSTQTGGIRHSLTVPTINLDMLFEEYAAPDFIKIDVEGAETLVFNGAKTLLSKCNPVILCECSAPNFKLIEPMLKELKYSIHDAEALPNLINFDPDKSQNFIAIPKK